MPPRRQNRLVKWLVRLGATAALAVLFVFSAYTAFSLYVRRGGTILPDVTTLMAAEARSRLEAVDVDLKVIEENAQFSAEVSEGAVVRQSPQAGATVKKGSVVRVALSRGPQLSYLPDFSGESLSVARSQVQAGGMPAPRVEWVFAPGNPSGHIVGQRPRPGDRAPANESLRLYANIADTGQTWVMPDVVYQDVEHMRRWFEARGIRVGSIKPDTYRGVPAGTILRQYPLSGYPVGPGSAVAFVVAFGDPADRELG